MATSILLRKALKNAIKNHHSFNLGSKRLSNNIYLNQKRFISFQHILSKLRGEKPKENELVKQQNEEENNNNPKEEEEKNQEDGKENKESIDEQEIIKPYENINYANKDNMQDVEYSHLSIDIIAFSSFIILFLGYIWWTVREEKLFKKLEFLKWGGIYDRRSNIKSILRILKLDDYGLHLAEPLVRLGIIEAIIPCLYEKDDEIVKKSLEIINLLSKNDFACDHLIRSHIIDDLRRHIHLNNDHLFFTLYNLCEYNESVKKEIAKDQYIIESIYNFIIERDDPISIRPIICLLNSLSKDKESLKYLIGYKNIEEILNPSNFFFVFEPDNFRSFVKNIKEYKGTNNELKKMCEEILQVPSIEQKYSKLKYLGFRSLIIFGISSVYTYIRCLWKIKALSPLTPNERAYIRRLMIQSPFISVLASFSFPIIEEILNYAQNNRYFKWESFRDIRNLDIAYLTLIPIYYGLGRQFGPIFILPSLFPFRYRDKEPPRYPSFIRSEFLTVYRQNVKLESTNDSSEGSSTVEAFFNQKLLISKLSSSYDNNNKK